MANVYGQEWPRFASYSVTPTSTTTTSGSSPIDYWADLKKKWNAQKSGGSGTITPAAPTVPSASVGYDMAALQDMAKTVNAFNLGEVQGQFAGGVPNYTNLVAQSSRNIADQLGGLVSQGTKERMAQGAAERGVARGGQLVDADYLRALGLTAEGQQQLGEQNLTAAIARAPRTDLFNIASMMITPQQQREYELAQAAQRTNEFNAETGRIGALNRGSVGTGSASPTGGIIQKYASPGATQPTNATGVSTQATYPSIPITASEGAVTPSSYAGAGWDEYFKQIAGSGRPAAVVPNYGINQDFGVSGGFSRSGWDDQGSDDTDYLNWYYGGY